jgi:hypothetical protein
VRHLRSQLLHVFTLMVVFAGLCPFLVPQSARAASRAELAAAPASPAVSSGACGSVLLAGSQWLDGLGVDVESNGPDQGTGTSCGGTSYVNNVLAGFEWQCVELVNRLYLTRGWTSVYWPGNGGDSSPTSRDSMYDQAPSSLSRQPNGSLSYIGPGDVVSVNEYDNGVFVPDGHVLIVDSTTRVTSGTINLVSQNDGSASDAITTSTATLTGGTLTLPSSGGWSYSVIGVVHAPSWVPGETALPANASPNGSPWFPSMTCPTATSCVAAGYYLAGSYQGMLVTGSGTTWQATETPLPAGATGGTLESVACASATSCVAVGLANIPGGYLGMLLTGSQTSWQAQTVPVPANAASAPGDNPMLWGVACPSTTSCVVAGEYDSTSASAMLLTGSGSSWTATEAPVPANAGPDWGVQLRSVACPSTTSCVAAGQYSDPASGYEQGLLVTGSGTTWQATETPLPANAAAKPSVTLYSVTCPSTTSCIATGTYFDSAGNQHGLLLTGSGTTWQATEAPLPANAAAQPGASLTRAACTSATSCVATGQYTDSSGNFRALLVTGSGTTWQAVDVPLPSAAAIRQSWLWGVACHAAASCMAVGDYQGRSGSHQALVVTGSGTSWQAIIVPLPADAATSPTAILTNVACPSTTWCIAAGGYFSSTGEKLLLETGSTSTQVVYRILNQPSASQTTPGGRREPGKPGPATGRGPRRPPRR